MIFFTIVSDPSVLGYARLMVPRGDEAWAGRDRFLEGICNNATSYTICSLFTSYLKAEWQHVLNGFSVPLYLRAHLLPEALSESIFCNNLADTVPNQQDMICISFV